MTPPPPKIVFELCAETLAACHAAHAGGAHRIELCARLDVGGLTPPDGLLRAAVKLGLPVHAMLRLRPGDFVYTHAEFQAMLDAIDRLRELGIAGIVAGVLTPGRTVDIARISQIVARAHPLQVTFHRAFDETANLEQALENVIASRCTRLLTSGGAPGVLAGAERLHRLNRQAAGRIVLAAGGGLRLENAAQVVRVSGLQHFHGTIRRTHPDGTASTETEDIRTVIALLNGGG